MTFFSDLALFPEQDVGIFVSRDGNGEIASAQAMGELPDPAALIAERFLPSAKAVDASAAGFPANVDMAGAYHWSRRAESSWLRLQELQTQLIIKLDNAGNAKLLAALFPFGDGATFKPVQRNLYEGPRGARFAFVNDAEAEPHIAQPGIRLQRVPWWLDLRWIVPALAISTLIVLLTLFAWPLAVLWRILRKPRRSEDDGDRRNYLAVRLVVIIDAIVIMTTAVVFAIGALDYTIFNDALDPLVLGLYALAWLGVLGVPVAIWAAITFWRNGTAKLWFRIHHSLLAASAVMLAWFFVTFRIAGTTLNY
jgi:hypothetical protein